VWKGSQIKRGPDRLKNVASSVGEERPTAPRAYKQVHQTLRTACGTGIDATGKGFNQQERGGGRLGESSKKKGVPLFSLETTGGRCREKLVTNQGGEDFYCQVSVSSGSEAVRKSLRGRQLRGEDFTDVRGVTAWGWGGLRKERDDGEGARLFL